MKQNQTVMKIKTITNGNVLLTSSNDAIGHTYLPNALVYLETNPLLPNILYVVSADGTIKREIDSSRVIATVINGVETPFSGTRADLYTLLKASFFTASSGSVATTNQILSDISKSEDSPHISGDKGIASLALRHDANTPTSDEGDYTNLHTNENGELKASLRSTEVKIENITTISASQIGALRTSVALVDATHFNAAMYYFTCANTFNGLFEFSNDAIAVDGVSGEWRTTAYQLNSTTPFFGSIGNTASASALQNYYKLSSIDCKYIRFRATSLTTPITATIGMSVMATEPTVSITGSLPTGSNTIGNVVLGSGANPIGTVALVPGQASGFVNKSLTVLGASTNPVSIKTTNATLGQVIVSNGTAALFWLKLYNKTSAPTVGTDVPVVTVLIPVGQTICLDYAQGSRYNAGLATSVSLNAASTDTTPLATAGVATINIDYA